MAPSITDCDLKQMVSHLGTSISSFAKWDNTGNCMRLSSVNKYKALRPVPATQKSSMNVSCEHSQLPTRCVSMLAFTDTAKPEDPKRYHSSFQNQTWKPFLEWQGTAEQHLRLLLHSVTETTSERGTRIEDCLLTE